MKRTLSCALALLTLLPALLTPARANSAPTHWEGSPGSEVLAVEADCPIAVLHEDLSLPGRRIRRLLPQRPGKGRLSDGEPHSGGPKGPDGLLSGGVRVGL